MPTFDTSFLLGSKKKGGSGAGMLTDQLTILENALGKDGLLSPGDYDLLITTAQQMANNGGLTPDQRSNYLVKVSSYQKEKSLATQKSTDDLQRMNRELDSESRDDVMAAGNNPDLFLQGRQASLESKLADLTEIIDRRAAAGDDTTEHEMEYNNTLADYRDLMDAKKATDQWKVGDKTAPIPGLAAYVVTNDRGEITDVSYGKFGSKSGYVETNGMINGFQVYGKVNQKENGQNIFKLGNERFSGTDSVTPDPTNPTVFKVSRLIAESQQSGSDAYKRGTTGYLNIDGNNLQTQSYVSRGQWFRGVNGTLYQRRDDGGYSKYLNYEPEGVDPSSILKIPQSLERRISPYVDSTIDGSASANPNDPGFIGPRMPQTQLGQDGIPISGGTGELGPSATPFAPTFNPQSGDTRFDGKVPTPTSQPVAQPVSVSSETKSPTQRSPQGPVQYAQQTINKAGKFFKDLFS